MSTIRLSEIEKRAEDATPGPWTLTDISEHKLYGWKYASVLTPVEGQTYKTGLGQYVAFHDASFVAHARTDIPALCSAVRELEDKLKIMLHTFDRGLTDGMLGRKVCDEARAVLENIETE